MRISDNFETLLNNFDSADLLNVTDITGASLVPLESGQTEALKFVVDAEESFTETTFFAIQAVDDSGNRGTVSNIVSIVVAKGYRLKTEPGSLTVAAEEVITKHQKGNSLAIIISGTVAGAMLLILCIAVVVVHEYRQSQVITIHKA